MSKKSILTLLIALLLTAGIMSGCASHSDAVGYSDVPEYSWYGRALHVLSKDNGIINGFDNDTFRPDDHLTYYQYIKALVLIIDNDFQPTDSDNQWFFPYAEKAIKLKLITKADLIAEDRPLTRGEMAVLTAKAMSILEPEQSEQALLEHTQQVTSSADENKYDILFLSDYFTLPPDIANSVKACYEAGLITGYKDGTFRMNDYLSRAEAIVVLHRMIEPEYRLDAFKGVKYNDYIVPIIKTFHNSGQTFIVFEEISKVDWAHSPTNRELYEAHQKINKAYSIVYRIYKDDKPITSLKQLKPIRKIKAFSGWNTEIHGINTKNRDAEAITYVCNTADGPLKPYQGLAVISSEQAGDAYYAITVSVNDKVFNTIKPAVNTTLKVSEKPDTAEPVLQKALLNSYFAGIPDTNSYFYTRWEPEKFSAIPDRPFDYLVVKPTTNSKTAAAGLHLHCWDGNLASGYGPWTKQGKDSILVSSNMFPYDWWTGYQEKHYDLNDDFYARRAQDYVGSVVRPYTTERLLSFVDWMQQSGQWQFDLDKLFVSGYSMGGAGATMMAIRYPDNIAWCKGEAGVHNPNNSPEYKLAYERVYGQSDYQPLYEDGTPAFDYYNDIWYLKKHRDKGLGLIIYSNGKNDDKVGWEQAVNFTKTLQETKQPHIFWWGQEGHQQPSKLPVNLSRDQMLLNLKVKQSLPAFTNCSLDDDYGDGDPLVGDKVGQVNGYLTWNPDTIVDETDRWQIELKLIKDAPRRSCTVDITARKLQKFKLVAGQELKYSIVRQSDQAVIGKGKIIVDNDGLFTIKSVIISKEPCKLSVESLR